MEIELNKSVNLPDPAAEMETAVNSLKPLDWVGMEAIQIQIRYLGQLLPASVDIGVALDLKSSRGIHMSRLFSLVQERLFSKDFSFHICEELIMAAIASQEGLSSSAKISLRFEIPLERKSLRSEISYLRSYPITYEIESKQGQILHRLGLELQYSSTCPASAALARQLNQEAFLARFGTAASVSVESMADWLMTEASQAGTPHAQRSLAQVNLEFSKAFDVLGASSISELIDLLVDSLKTEVQGSVKRADEQAFAKLNAENLMFCEDAARRLSAVLSTLSWAHNFSGKVSHFESLHAHNAVAYFSK